MINMTFKEELSGNRKSYIEQKNKDKEIAEEARNMVIDFLIPKFRNISYSTSSKILEIYFCRRVFTDKMECYSNNDNEMKSEIVNYSQNAIAKAVYFFSETENVFSEKEEKSEEESEENVYDRMREKYEIEAEYDSKMDRYYFRITLDD